ncbi:hypothetical protein P8452_23712 [Trifolium repens]|nr:hypothetical protein P8452_23712 [Trifolium repens]
MNKILTHSFGPCQLDMLLCCYFGRLKFYLCLQIRFSQSNPPTCFKINGNLSSSCCPRTHLTMEVSRLLKHLVGTRLYLCGLCLLSTNV